MANNFPFTSKEICIIIKTSAQARVTKLKFGTLEVEFSPDSVFNGQSVEAPLSAAALVELQHQQQEISDRALLQTELALKDQELDELHITEPLKYEELLVGGELTEEDGNQDESDEEVP